MRFATLKQGDSVLIADDNAIPLSELGFEGDLIDLIQSGNEALEMIRDASAGLEPGAGSAYRPDELDAPISTPSKIVAIGLNYLDHASESKMDVPEHPLVFTKFTNSITGPRDPIVIPTGLTGQVDYEVELGIVIGREAKNVAEEEALSHVFGYTVLNDVSARDLQFADEQWVRGKSLDTFCPLGPVIVTGDEIEDPQAFEIGCSVNGETLQQANTRDMIFDVAALVSILSHSFTLKAGDLIASGTPQGVGFSREPPIFLREGDTVKTWVEGIGELVNPVVER
ncbi:MAG: fumarylacetoacetate hydrolase family protein [Balneolaceae bacterium]|nr:fumarylacetoacetate hydrolase family protein [Balneolaceae bacterium]